MARKPSCELCKNQAAIFCESDEASLCWKCDQNIHSANFLVAKHSRTLLCHVCSSPTSWKSSGLKLGPSFSFCQACSAARILRRQDLRENNSMESETDDNGKYYAKNDSDYYSEEEEENGENQVVPWECSSKRTRDVDVCEDGCCSNSRICVESDQSSFQVRYDGNDTSLLRPLKTRLLKGSEAVVDKLRRLQ